MASREENLESFRCARFGLFIHWGLYTLPGGRWKGQKMSYIGEWLQSKFRIPNAEYEQLATQFTPVNFDADEWMRLASAAGMRYLVFTAKHHEGFAMFHSRVSKFNIVDATPFKRDVLAEIAFACKKYGMKLGIYYSQYLDWHEPNGGDPGPQVDKNISDMSWGNDWDYPKYSEKNFSEYFYRKSLPQVRELLSNYGPVSILWFDCPMNMKKEYCEELRDTVHTLQPDCLINARIGYGCGDYGGLGDNQLTAGKVRDVMEAPATLNDTWGFKYDDHNWKSAESVIENLVSLSEKDTNYLLNIGPQGDGAFPPTAKEVLEKLAVWYGKNGSSITATDGTPFPQELNFAYCTQKGKTLNLILKHEIQQAQISGILSRIVSCDVPYMQNDDVVTLDFSKVKGVFPVVKIQFDEVPRISKILSPQNGTCILYPGTAKLKTGNNDSISSGGVRYNTEGKLQDIACHAHLCNDGTLANWHNPQDSIVWKIRIPDGGTYQVTLVSRQQNHSQPWIGDRKVEIHFADDVLVADLVADNDFHNPYYATVESVIGKLSFKKNTVGELSLRTVSAKPDSFSMSLINLVLNKISD